MSLADRVKESRKKQGWNQATLALKSGVTQATISRIESGKVEQPKMAQLLEIATALETTIDYLAGQDESEQQALMAAWEKSNGILRDIRDLASINVSLAFGLIRMAETMVEMIMISNMDKIAKVDKPTEVKDSASKEEGVKRI